MNKITIIIITFFFYFFFKSYANSETINNIEIIGNERISSETISMFANVEIKEHIDNDRLNKILKNLYETNFFDNISVKIDNKTIKIKVLESLIIEKIIFTGVKSNSIKESLRKILKLKSRSSLNNYQLEKDIITIKDYLKKK